jgi:6-pyruvoyltetrahydropterin/6-carboxytetrahydropterin synthase
MSLRLEIDGWKAKICFSSAHLLPGHVKCSFLHGHTYAIHIRVYGEKNNQGYIIDFSEIKNVVKQIADCLDHKILIANGNSCFCIKENEVIVSFDDKKFVFPLSNCVVLPIDNVTAENLAEYVFSQVIKKLHLPSNVSAVEIGVDEGVGQGAWINKTVG